MPNVRLTWTNNSSGHDGQRVRMDAPSSDGPDTVIADIGPNVEEYIALAATKPEACFTVAAYDGGTEEESGVACVETADWDNVSVGDYVGGGVYAGIITYADARQFHIVAALQSGESGGIQWKTSNTSTAGTLSDDDGIANTQSMESSGIAEHPAAQHCVNYDGGGYMDWYMPARNELGLVYSNLAAIDHAEFVTSQSVFRLSSTEGSSGGWAWSRRFSDGNETQSSWESKTSTARRVRPIRRVPV